MIWINKGLCNEGFGNSKGRNAADVLLYLGAI